MMKKYLYCPFVSLVIMLFLFSFQALAQENKSERLIKFETSLGDMLVMLYDETPGHRDNMIKLIEEGFYKDQLFHRVMKDFMIQGGDPHSVGADKGQRLGSGGPGYTVPAEFNEALIHKKGALAAARKGDQVNPEQASSGSQFYLVQGHVLTPEEINILAQRGVASFTKETAEIYTTLGGTPHLDGAYTVFGEIVEGLEVLDLIAAQPCDAYDRPMEDVIFSISIVR
ncbi:MAG: peptidylprolyl isomerase [Anaerolineales bacterium]|nr:peptidylprolyl isomerase [Anaerolineales bacterium]